MSPIPSMPGPTATFPEPAASNPNKIRSGCHPDHYICLRRWWRRTGDLDFRPDYGRWRRRLDHDRTVAIAHFVNDATCE
jgi:hypothetical protein